MNLLLDTHTFIRSYDEQHKLSRRALQEMSDTSNALFLSVASVWEIQIKIQTGKFKFKILPVQLSHALYLENLPLHHKDPFDRLLISQAIVENMILVSANAGFAKYQVKLRW